MERGHEIYLESRTDWMACVLEVAANFTGENTRMNQETWLTDGPRHTKLTLGHKHANIIKTLNTTLSKNRQNYRTAVHLITGHCGLNKHLHTIRKSSTSACPMCGDEEKTVSHFLGQCPAIAQIRGQYFQDYYLSVNDILDNQHITTIVKFAPNA